MKSIIGIALGGAASLSCVQAAESLHQSPALTVQAASALPSSTGAAETFSGSVQISAPFQALPPGRAGGATVSFAAQARTAWHSHPLGQILIVTAGLGLVQQAGQPAQVLQAGDVVTIPPNVRHWHGAGPRSAMTHVAISEKLDAQAVAWQSLVTEEEYRAAVVATGLEAQQGRALAGPAPSATLSPRQLSIVAIASFAASSDLNKLSAALNQGLDEGISIGEAKEILVQLYAYAGFPRSLNALGQLLNVVQARAGQGKRDEPGRSPSPLVLSANERLALGRANQAAIAGGPVTGPVFEFAPEINLFLQSHLFSDIFARDNLDWQSRELARLGALAAMSGVEPQLRSHVQAGMRVGLSREQLRHLARHLASIGMDEAAARLGAALGPVPVTASGG